MLRIEMRKRKRMSRFPGPIRISWNRHSCKYKAWAQLKVMLAIVVKRELVIDSNHNNN
jgi:hypothetical protein